MFSFDVCRTAGSKAVVAKLNMVAYIINILLLLLLTNILLIYFDNFLSVRKRQNSIDSDELDKCELL